MIRGKEKAAAAWQGNDGRAIDTEHTSKESIVKKNISLPTTTDKDYRGFTPAAVTVMTAAGFAVKADSLLLKSLCNADESRNVDRSRYYLVNL